MTRRRIAVPSLPPAKVEMLNLIDVLMTLVAFFLLTTVFVREQRELGVKLPLAQHGVKFTRPARKIVIELDRRGQCYVEHQPVDMEELNDFLKKQNPTGVVLIRADQNCSYGRVVRLLDTVKGSKLRQIGFEVRNNQER